MPDFINTIDALGDDAVIDSIIERTITEFKDDKITSLGCDAFHGCSQLTTVYLPNVATMDASSSVGTQFFNCSSLVDINLPLVDTLGLRCFAGCSSLPKIVLPNITSRIYSSAFSGCTNLRFVDIHKTCAIFGGAHFTNCKNLIALILRGDGLVTLGGSNCFTSTPIESGLGYIYVPGNLVNSYKSATNWSTYAEQFRGIIGDEEALQGIIDETLIDFENNELESIPAYSFYNYAPLKSVKANAVAEIGESAFENCTGLDSINLSNVVNIGKNAFKGCSAITELTSEQFPNADTIEAGAFENCPNITVIDLPTVTQAPRLGTVDCTALTSVNLPNLESKNNVGYSLTFARCSNLVSVNCPKLERFSFYGGNEFAMCTNLTSVNVPSLVRVGNAGFSKCTSLTKLDLPKVTSIGNNTFEHTSSLIALILRSDSVCTVGTDAFKGTSAIGNGTGYIYVPRALIEDYKVAANWSAYASQFRALEDYTVDGTTTGELDETKI